MSFSVYIDLEVKKRDMHSRLLVGAVILKRLPDAKIYIGRRLPGWIIGWLLKPDVVIRKNTRMSGMSTVTRLKASGVNVVNIDEEGIVYGDLNTLIRHSYPEKMVANTDLHFIAGSALFERLKESYPEHECKFKLVGNPRTALWSEGYFGYFDRQVDELKHRWGEYILISSNFPMVSNEQAGRESRHSAGNLEGSANLEHYLAELSRAKKIYHSFIDLVEFLCASGKRVIIRAHPVDSIDVLMRDFNHPMVSIVTDSQSFPWLSNCICLIHNGCTTSIEAKIMGIPTIAYCKDNLRRQIPDRLNIASDCIATSEHEVLIYLENKGQSELKNWNSELLEPAVNFDVIVEELISFKTNRDISVAREKFFKSLNALNFNFLKIYRIIVSKFSATKKARLKVIEAKFPETKKAELETFLECCRRRIGCDKKFKVSNLGPNVFRIGH